MCPHLHHICVEGAAGCPPPAQGRGVREWPHLTSLPRQVGPGTALPSKNLWKEPGMSPLPTHSVSDDCPSASWATSTTASHHLSVDLRSLRERKGGTFKSQRLTELPEAKKRLRSTWRHSVVLPVGHMAVLHRFLGRPFWVRTGALHRTSQKVSLLPT